MVSVPNRLRPRWRLVIHDGVDGALNMALDRAIQLSREQGSSPPTVRLYRWARPTVTLGHFQPSTSVDLRNCGELGVDVVRRFTGGRGVLHDDELTYSVVASTDDGVPRGVAASYLHLSAALIETYRELGLDSQVTAGHSGERSASACYLQTTRADLSHKGAKLAGSAQVWSGSTVMQHGSLTVSRDLDRERRVFALSDVQVEQMRYGTVTLEESLHTRVESATLIAAFVTGFERGLGIEFVPGDISALEAELAVQLIPNVQVDINGTVDSAS